MSEIFTLFGFFLSLAAFLLGAEFIRRLNVQHGAIQGLNERLLANEVRMAAQEQSNGKNMVAIQRLNERQHVNNIQIAEQGQLLDRNLKEIERLNERLVASEIRAAEQERSQDRNVKTLQQLERQAQETRNVPAAAGAAEAGGGKDAAKG